MHFVRLGSSQVFTYLGDRFPQMNIGDPPAAIIEILPDTQEKGWRVGFYLAAQPPFQFEQTLRAVRAYWKSAFLNEICNVSLVPIHACSNSRRVAVAFNDQANWITHTSVLRVGVFDFPAH
jgi:hypothetical protein